MNTVYEEEEYNPHVIPQKPVGLVTRSKYEEDVLVNNHTCVWGSWYNPTFGWGYQCCYAVDRNAQCLGIKGREKTLARELRIKAEQLRKSELLATKEIDQQQKQ